MHSRSLALRIALPALLLGLPYVLLPGYRVLRGDAHSQLGVPGICRTREHSPDAVTHRPGAVGRRLWRP